MLIEPVPRWPDLTRDGAVPATADLPWGRETHATSFATGLALRALRTYPAAAPIRGRMLDFLLRCEATEPPGAFGFWPSAARPAWASRVPADADDTAICLTELALAGRMARAEARRRALRLLAPNRVRASDGDRPPWVPEGAFRTWLVPAGSAGNPVDCAANANVLALFAALGLRDAPGWRAAIALIETGLAWAGATPARLRALTPFYPNPAEFRLALAHAVACGCAELAPAAERLASIVGPDPPGPEAVLCSAAYGRDGWRSPALAAIRLACRPSEARQP
jgi:hypothetical protein